MLIWLTRLCLVFAMLVLLAFSWRVSLIVAACLMLEFFGMIVAAMPEAGFWSVARLMLGLGLLLGAVTTLGDQRRNYWELPLLAFIINLLLALSWGRGLGGLGNAWAGYIVSIVSLPVGCLCAAAAFDVYRREKRRRSQRRT